MKTKIFTDEKTENIYNNLKNQTDRIMNECNQGSIKTRYRYKEATERFCSFLAQEYKLQKFENVKSKHVISYVEYLKSEGCAPSTIKTDIAGIRFFHRQTDSKNILVDNSKFDLEQRSVGKIDRSWSDAEIEKALCYSKEIGRLDVYNAIKLSSVFGLRLEEVVKVTPAHLKSALSENELWTRGKNGQERYIQIRNQEQIAVIKEVLTYVNSANIKSSEKILTDNVRGGVQREKRSIQNFITNHQNRFIDKDRQKQALTNEKPKTANLNWHGLRYAYAQQLNKDLQSDNHRERKVSESLGHRRTEITKIYLK